MSRGRALWLVLALVAACALVLVAVIVVGRRSGGDSNPEPGKPGAEGTSSPAPVSGGPIAPVRPAKPPAGPASPAVPPEIRKELAMFSDTSIPLEKRETAVADLARGDDRHSVDVLMALGNEQVYLNAKAVEVLGRCSDPRVPEYLKARLAHEDFSIATAAIRAYGRNQEEKAVPELVAAVVKNRVRPDGYQLQVCSEAVQALGRMGPAAAAAVPGLAGELGRCGEKGWNPQYGSVLVTALGNIGGAEAKRAIETYAGNLSGMIPSDPMAKKYFEDRIAEARAAAAGKINRELLGPEGP